MRDILSLAYDAAQKSIGEDRWWHLPDRERLRIMREQVCRMDIAELEGRPLFTDPACARRPG